MIHHLKDLIHSLIQTFLHNPNQFASGGLLLMAVGGIITAMRALPAKLWAHLLDQFTVSLVLNDDAKYTFYDMRRWLQEQEFMKKARHLDVTDSRGDMILNPAPGMNRYMWQNGRLFQVFLERTEKKESTDSYMSSAKRAETIHIRTYGRDKTVFREMLKQVQKHNEEIPKPKLYVWGNREWNELSPYLPRPLDSVIMAAGVTEKIVKDIDIFLDSEEWYQKMGIPYRRGYLLEGPPGTGKSSLAAGLSAHFNANVYFLKLQGLTDEQLRDSVAMVTADSFIILEDVDTVSATKNRNEGGKNMKVAGKQEKELLGVTLSGLLNVLDGMLAPKGAVFVMTTNHVDVLDPALIRPGRVDMRLHIGAATVEQKRKLFDRFYPGESMPAVYEEQHTMAEIQQILMDERNRRAA